MDIFISYDIIKIIFNWCDFTEISEKSMRLISHQCKNVMDNNSYPGILGRVHESNIHHIRNGWSLQTWDYVSKYLILKNWFIHQFCDKVNWKIIIEHQSLSQQFINEHLKYIDIQRKEIPNVITRYVDLSYL
jgi:hypothetical protein